MTTKEKLKAIAAKYVTPFIYDNLVTNVQFITVSSQKMNLERMVVLSNLRIEQDQTVKTSVKVLNKIASDIGATGYLEAAPKVAADIYDVMIGDGYTCIRGDKAAYVEYYVNVFKELTKLRQKDVNVMLLNFTSMSIEFKNLLIDPCSMFKYYTEEEKKELFDDGTTLQRRLYLVDTRAKEIARAHYSYNTKDQECGFNSRTGSFIFPDSSITQTVNVEAAIEIVNTVYTDAFNSEDFYKPSEPSPPTTTPPAKGGFPVWAMILIALGICLVLGGLIILSGDSNN